ncbi:hypothetical protein EW026_g4155 [Hermanssonia centrifuga]|uniref:Response regulatory domain-containing protein n=1 Tax=Hermanssonia centrifuga TaxID=98765 RepID=A0A4S4KMN4_9APHY|nr:hypothetical protein EW026_g4155 [Hermanssonia centrifuga]
MKAEEPTNQTQQQQPNFASDANPFLPVTEAQRMMGGASYPDMDIARASLLQMNEISRRAEVAGMTFSTNNNINAPTGNNNNGNNPSSSSTSAGPSSGNQTQPSRSENSASRIMAAAAGLMPDRPMSRQDALARIEELSRARPTSAQGQRQMQAQTGSSSSSPLDNVGSSSLSSGMVPNDAFGMLAPDDRYGVPLNNTALSHEGLQVFTVGHLMPKSTLDDENGNWSFDPHQLNNVNLNAAVVMPTPQGMGCDPPQEGENERQQPIVMDSDPGPSSGPSSGQTLRVRRSTYVPGWAVPPRVLLVDDDAVSRKLSSKFLQVFGCAIDVAVDGVGAVNKMNLEKYDLVLMDIVMPKLDGVSATSLIRQFDHMTPIISMTSNSKPNEIIKYYSSGMNDILPKPFTKDGLLEMLEKHLMHLKVIQTMSRVPRSVGIPPLSDNSFDQAFAMQAASMSAPGNFNFSPGEDDGKINPLAGMGLTDEQYSMILQNLVNGESFMGIGMSAVDTGSSMLDGGKRRWTIPTTDGTASEDGLKSSSSMTESRDV